MSSAVGGWVLACGLHIIYNLALHIMDHHLEPGQLWLCPVEWCTVWKGSVKDCLDHLHSKHDGAQFLDMKTLGTCFPPWRAALQLDVSGVATDVKLFQESGCRLIHRYRIYRYPMPHVSLQGKVIRNLITFVHRTMAIAQLTRLHLTIPSSGMTTEPVPPDCFPIVPLTRKPAGPNKVSFAADVEVIGSPPNLSSPEEEPDSPDQSLPAQPGCGYNCTSDLCPFSICRPI